MLHKMNQEQIVEVLKSAGGRIFSVRFIKRSTGEERLMVCRFGVKKDLTGEGMKYNPESKGLLSVFDMQKEEYRMINLDTVFWAKINGEEIA